VNPIGRGVQPELFLFKVKYLGAKGHLANIDIRIRKNSRAFSGAIPHDTERSGFPRRMRRLLIVIGARREGQSSPAPITVQITNNDRSIEEHGSWEKKGNRSKPSSITFRVVLKWTFRTQWGRARSIRDAYMQVIQGQQPSDGLTPLTTADVFNWLFEKGHFITRRISPSVPKEGMNEVVKSVDDDTWCPCCGQKEMRKDQTATTPVKAEPGTSIVPPGHPGIKSVEDGIANSKCNPGCLCPSLEHPATKMPIVNVFTRLDLDGAIQNCGEPAPKSGGFKAFRDADLVKAAHPQMTMAVRDIVHRLKLASFLPPPAKDETIGGSKRSLEAQLAPHASLAIATQCFLRVLIEGGLHVSKKDAVVSGPTRSKRRPQVTRGEGSSTSMLTPVHILSGLLSRMREPDVRGTEVNRMAYELLTRLGAPIEPRDRGVTESEEEMVPSIKVEEF